MEITGEVLELVDDRQVASVVRELVARHQVQALAVSGFVPGTVNPEHELAVKQIILDETGLSVTCGHELLACNML